MSKSLAAGALALVAAGVVGGFAVGSSSASATTQPEAPYVAPECRQAVDIVRAYNATQDQSERDGFYRAYLDYSGRCLAYPAP